MSAPGADQTSFTGLDDVFTDQCIVHSESGHQKPVVSSYPEQKAEQLPTHRPLTTSSSAPPHLSPRLQGWRQGEQEEQEELQEEGLQEEQDNKEQQKQQHTPVRVDTTGGAAGGGGVLVGSPGRKEQAELGSPGGPRSPRGQSSGLYTTIYRQTSLTMITTVRTVKIRDLLEGGGYIYKFTSEWGLNFPESNGENQSPINISSREAGYDETLKENPLTLNYVLSRETDICNNGHTVVVCPRYKPGDAGFRTDAMPKSTLRGGPLAVGHEYELAEFRFHWGRENVRGSEHTVNFKAFPMELHLIHWNTSLYPCLEDALGKPDGVAVIVLFIQIGRGHPGIKLLAEHLEDIQYKGRQKTITTAFNPNCLLPDPMLRDYWTYQGSLTSPPCCENVTWIIFRYPLTVCNAQIEEFRRMRTHQKGEEPPDGEDGQLVDNFRATQPLNDRKVRASFQ